MNISDIRNSLDGLKKNAKAQKKGMMQKKKFTEVEIKN